jgi:CubicO group peptidase (beta-lactamase class C family)
MMLWLLLFCALPDEKAVDADVRAAMKAWRVPGVAVVLVSGEDTLARGYGVRAAGKDDPVTADTLFSLGSCGKAFTAAALGDLVADGKLGWDDRVSKHLKWFKLSDPLASRDVTVRDLLCHRTGLAGHEWLWYRSRFAPAEAVRRAGLLPPEYGFRTTFYYQSTMVTAAGLVAAEADGKPWGEVIRSRVLKPLKMNATFVDTASAEKGGTLAGFHALDAEERPVAMPPHRWAEGDAAGSIYSSASDVAKWLRYQLSGDERLKETHTPQIVLRDAPADRLIFPDTTQRSYGLGWVIYDHKGHKIVAHGGALEGHRAHIAFAPGRGVGVAVLSNLHQTSMNAALSSRLMDRLLGLEPRDWDAAYLASLRLIVKARAEARAKTLDAARSGTPLPPRDHAGSFSHPAYGDVRLVLRDDRLLWREEDDEAALEPLGKGTFLLRSDRLGEVVVTFRDRDAFTLSTLPGVVFRRGAR